MFISHTIFFHHSPLLLFQITTSCPSVFSAIVIVLPHCVLPVPCASPSLSPVPCNPAFIPCVLLYIKRHPDFYWLFTVMLMSPPLCVQFLSSEYHGWHFVNTRAALFVGHLVRLCLILISISVWVHLHQQYPALHYNIKAMLLALALFLMDTRPCTCLYIHSSGFPTLLQ